MWRIRIPWLAVSLLLHWSLHVPAHADDAGAWLPFVLPWNDAAPTATDVSFLLEAPAGKRGIIAARDGHFWAGDRRIRFWGVNVCFAACFPSHDDAAQIAARLAKFGVNCVRFHHMDSAPFPRGIFQDRRLEELSPEALDRLDRFIHELAIHGIYANLNLHVSRWLSRARGWPSADALESYDKMLNLFHPELIAAQQRFARDLLLRENPYRKLRYRDDPAVAMVEITNENSLFMWSAPRRLPDLPEPYAAMLAAEWNAWLKTRYADDAALDRAWSMGASPLGANLLKDAAFATLADAAARVWILERHAGAAMRAERVVRDGMEAVRLVPEMITDTEWHLQFHQPGMSLAGDAFYTVRFRARADAAKRITVGVSQAHQPWANLGLSSAIALSTAWQDFSLGFKASAADTNARLSFAVGGDLAALELAQVGVHPGGKVGLGAGESAARGSVALYPARSTSTEERELDRLRFFAHIEQRYFTDMRDFLVKELGVKAPITGTIAFGALGTMVQAQLDFVDQHAYWRHPHFPRRPWDSRDWIVRNDPMSADRSGGTLPGLAVTRVLGRPYTITEYNHPAPMDSQAETVPMLASFAAHQDWDGVFLFSYSHSDQWRRERFQSFFDIDANPAKMGFMPAGALMFLGGRYPPAASAVVRRMDMREALAAAQRSVTHLLPHLHATGFDWTEVLRSRWYLSLDATGAPPRPNAEPRTALRWEPQKDARYVADSPASKVLCGRLAGAPIELEGLRVQVHAPRDASITAVSLDDAPLSAARRILVTACARAENTDMGWNERRDSVADRWGAAPVRIEVVDATLTLATRAPSLTVHALDPRGAPGTPIPARAVGGGAFAFRIGGEGRSLWYLVETGE